jgi:beta-galactosidase
MSLLSEIEFAPGSLKAVGRNDGKPVAAQEELTTAGPPAQIKLTPITGPRGLQADGAGCGAHRRGSVDAKGRAAPPTTPRRFHLTGPAIWRGGYNSGKIDSTNNLYLNTECGINRVAVRSTGNDRFGGANFANGHAGSAEFWAFVPLSGHIPHGHRGMTC